jgi:hypothetical protein
MKFSVDELAEFLVDKWDYVPSQSLDIAKKILNMSPDILESFEIWLKTGNFTDVPEYSSYSPKKIYALGTLKQPAVFLLLDWIRREPDDAIEAIDRELIRR